MYIDKNSLVLFCSQLIISNFSKTAAPTTSKFQDKLNLALRLLGTSFWQLHNPISFRWKCLLVHGACKVNHRGGNLPIMSHFRSDKSLKRGSTVLQTPKGVVKTFSSPVFFKGDIIHTKKCLCQHIFLCNLPPNRFRMHEEHFQML